MKRLLVVCFLFVLVLTVSGCSLFSEPSNEDLGLTTEFTVSFNSDGAGEVASETVKEGEYVTEPKAPEKDGFVFLGWYLGGEKWDFSGDTVTSDITLVAKWQEAHVHNFTGATCTEPGKCSCGENDGTPLGHTPGAAAGCINAEICTVCGEELKAALGHTPGAPADCTNSETCTVCGAKLADALGHDWDDGKVTTAPDCTNAGVKTYTCKHNSEHTKTEVIGALGHDWDNGEVTTAPTCTADGIKTYTCKNDPTHTYTETLKSTGHTPGAPADCENDQICTVCGAKLADKLGHDWDEGKVTTAPDCTNAGVKTYTCKNDSDHTKTEAIGALGHEWDEGKVTTAPDCTNAGVMTYTCKHNADHTKTEAIGALGHHAVEGEYCHEATVCDKCGTTLESLEHIFKDATCQTPKTCSKCGFTEGDVGNHSYVDTVVEPTCTEGGYTKHVCSVCGDSYTDSETQKLGHKEVTDEAKAPGCETVGLTEGSHCERCGEILVAQKEIEAIGHDWDDGEITKHPDCENAGEGVFTCKNNPEHTETVVIEPIGHDWDDGKITTSPTCEGEGIRTYTCKNDGSHTYTETVNALGHKKGTAANCTNSQNCTVCGAVIVEAYGHKYVVTDNATCTNPGNEIHKCSVCGHEMIGVNTPALGHSYKDGLCTACCAKDPTYTDYIVVILIYQNNVDENTVLFYKPAEGCPNLPTPKREGYDFVGWYSSTTYAESTKVTSLDSIEEDTTLYGFWKKSNSGGGSGSGTTTPEVPF